MRYRDYEMRRLDVNRWEIVQWFPKQPVECCVVVMFLEWNEKDCDVEIKPVMERILRTYQTKNFDKWLDICLKYIQLSKEVEEEGNEVH